MLRPAALSRSTSPILRMGSLSGHAGPPCRTSEVRKGTACLPGRSRRRPPLPAGGQALRSCSLSAGTTVRIRSESPSGIDRNHRPLSFSAGPVLVDGRPPRPALRAICGMLRPAALSRSTSPILRMGSFSWARGTSLPNLRSPQGDRVPALAFKAPPAPPCRGASPQELFAFSRNDRPDSIGITVRNRSESPSAFVRITQSLIRCDGSCAARGQGRDRSQGAQGEAHPGSTLHAAMIAIVGKTAVTPNPATVPDSSGPSIEVASRTVEWSRVAYFEEVTWQVPLTRRPELESPPAPKQADW